MYQASSAYVPHDVLNSGELNIVDHVPGGAIGFLLKACTLSNTVYADSYGLTLKIRSMFSVS